LITTGRDIWVVRWECTQLDRSIKSLGPLFVTLLLALTTAAGGDFTKALTPDKIRAAGLGKLTPEELEQLDVFVQEYKGAALTPAPAAVSAPVSAATPAPAALEPTRSVVSPGATVPKSGSVVPSWVEALLTLERTGKQADKSAAMESRLTGEFTGWSGRTSFKLENGQVWQQANSDQYDYTPPLKAPKVQIYPASLGTFWLKIEGVNQRCRVKPVRME
jgi:hypothetical protein